MKEMVWKVKETIWKIVGAEARVTDDPGTFEFTLPADHPPIQVFDFTAPLILQSDDEGPITVVEKPIVFYVYQDREEDEEDD